MKFTTSKEQEDLRKKVRAFAEKEIKPIAFMMDQNNLFPKEYGGMGGDTMTFGKPSIVLCRCFWLFWSVRG